MTLREIAAFELTARACSLARPAGGQPTVRNFGNRIQVRYGVVLGLRRGWHGEYLGESWNDHERHASPTQGTTSLQSPSSSFVRFLSLLIFL